MDCSREDTDLEPVRSLLLLDSVSAEAIEKHVKRHEYVKRVMTA